MYIKLLRVSNLDIICLLYNIKEFTDKDIDERIEMIKLLPLFEKMEKKQKTLTNNIMKFVKNKFRNDIRKYNIINDDSFIQAWA